MYGILKAVTFQITRRMYRWIFTLPNIFTGNELNISVLADCLDDALVFANQLDITEVSVKHLTYVEEQEGDVIYEEDAE